MTMRVFVSTNFQGHWPVGTAAVVFADTIEDAAQHLSSECHTAGIPQEISISQLQEIHPLAPTAYILNDGNY